MTDRPAASRMPWALYFWPGLPQLWARGSWYALGMAAVAAGFLNLALLSSFVWSELLARDLRSALWVLLGVAWIAAATFSAGWPRRLTNGGQAGPCGGTFAEAVEHYLRGDYFQAERVLGGLLRKNVRDLDARLMLATLMRHSGRFDEAAAELDSLVRFEGAAKWELEIRRERELLTEAKAKDETAVEQDASPDATDPPDGMMHAA